MNFHKLKVSLLLFFTAILCGWPACAQDDSEPVTTHYVLPDFVKGSVKMKTGKIEEAVMNYNMITEEMIFEKGSTRLAMTNTETIDTVYLVSRKFIPHEKVFYEVLIKDKVSLFVRHKYNLLPAGKPAGYGTSSETSAITSISALINSGSMYKLKLPDEYHITNDSQFWITSNNIPFRITNVRQFLKIFPEKSKEIEQFIKQNKLDIRKQKDLTILITKCNELLQ